MPNRVLTTAQDLDPGAIISLFQVDTRSVGGSMLYFVQDTEVGEEIMFGGVPYRPTDIKFDGLETSGQGALPSPTISLSNTDGFAQLAVNTFGDLLGCEVQRIRTFARHLDGHEDTDPGAYFGPDKFLIERKTAENPEAIEWELSAHIDQEGKQLPGRHVIRDTCMARYRAYNPLTDDFKYARAQCPYTGNDYFNEQDEPVVEAIDDQPSRTVECCKLRFGRNKPLPFWGFPGVGRAA